MKQRGKQLASILLAIVMVIAMMPSTVKAADAKVYQKSFTYVNPLYEDMMILDIEEEAPVTKASGDTTSGQGESTYLTTIEEAGAVLRAGMVDRQENISVNIQSTEDYNTVSNEILLEALRHTGVADEGDYLLYHYAGMGVSISYSVSGDTYYYTFTFGMKYHDTADQNQQAIAKAEAILESLNLACLSDYAKVKTIYDYLVSHITYDDAALAASNAGDTSGYEYAWTAYGALIENTCVCQGYSEAFYLLCLKAGIDARIICGYGGESSGQVTSNHAWNIVKIGSNYYNVDATWDSNIYTSYGSVGSVYFLKGSTAFTDEGIYGNVHVPMAYTNLVDYTDAAFTTASADYVKTDADDAGKHTPGQAVCENEISVTCTEGGSYEEVVYCTVCRKEISRTEKYIEATGHTAGEAVIENEIAATCSHEGSYEEVVYCQVCQVELSRTRQTIKKLEHTPGEAVKENEVAATCQADGSYEEVVYCQVCKEELSRTSQTIKKLVHTPGEAVKENEIAATCTENGSYDEVVRCTSCNSVISSETTIIPATGHSYDVGVVTKKATCTEAGQMTYICSKCGAQTYEDIQASGHTEVKDPAVAATCEESGLTEGSHCSVCGTVIVAQTEIQALGHTAGESVIENATEAACTKGGSYEEVVYCTVCRKEISRTQKDTEAAGHTPGEVVIENEIAATCSHEGSYEEVVYCQVCKEELSRTSQTIKKLEHTPGEAVKENETAATCTEGGSYDLVVRCSVCATVLSIETVELQPLGHNYEDGECTRCFEKDPEAGQVPETPEEPDTPDDPDEPDEPDTPTEHSHTPAEPVKENEVAATCNEAGSYDLVTYCDECGEKLSVETVVVEALEHSWDEGVVTKEATIFSTGTKTYTCETCGQTKTETIARKSFFTFGQQKWNPGTSGGSSSSGSDSTSQTIQTITNFFSKLEGLLGKLF